jgi:hypothetical protein
MKLSWDEARWMFLLTFACLAISPCVEARDLSPREKAVAQCRFAGSALEGFNQWSIVGQGYTRVFSGTVLSADDLSKTERRLELIPDEVFVGDKSALRATINHACLPDNEPELKAGDKWLFYIRPKPYVDEITHQIKVDGGLEIPWRSPSKPVSEAGNDIAILRRLGKLTDKGILAGNVVRIGDTIENLNPRAVPNHKVIAKNLDTLAEYTSFTDRKGRFEFELPHGHYEVSASTNPGLRDADQFTENAVALASGLAGNAVVRQHDWTAVDFRLVVDGKLAGQVTTADGRPASFAKVAIIPISPVRPQFVVDADENGHFEVDGRQPGKYIVGVGLLAPFDSADWKSRVYYPGVTSKKHAKVIELGDGQWRTDVNFRLIAPR